MISLGAGAAGYFASGRISTAWTPPGVTYRTLSRSLPPNQRYGVGLAAAAGGLLIARQAVDSNEDAARAVRALGSVQVRVADSWLNPLVLVESVREKARRAEEARERERQRAYGRAHTQAARVVKPEY